MLAAAGAEAGGATVAVLAGFDVGRGVALSFGGAETVADADDTGAEAVAEGGAGLLLAGADSPDGAEATSAGALDVACGGG